MIENQQKDQIEDSSLFTYNAGLVRQLLNLLSKDRQSFITFRSCLKAEYFTNDFHRYIYGQMVGFYDSYKSVPTEEALAVCVKDDLKKSKQFDEALINEEIALVFKSKVENEEWLKQQTANFIKEYVIRDSLEKTFELANKKAYNAIPEVWKEVTKAQISTNRLMLLEDPLEWMRTLEEEAGLVTSLPTLTKILKGGWRPGELNVFMAKTNVGKSIQLVCESACALIEGKKNIFFATCEMAGHKIAKRLATKLGGENYDKLIASHGEEKYANALKALKQQTGADIVIKKYKPGEATGAVILADVLEAQVATDMKFSAIVVDYLDEMVPNAGRTSSDYMDQRDVCQELIATGEELNVPIITATQATRSGGKEKNADGSVINKPLEAEDVGDSYWVSRLAHVLITMNQTPEMRAAGRLDYFVAKNRDGEKGQLIKTEINYSKLEIREQTSNKAKQVANLKQSLGVKPDAQETSS